MRRINKKVLLAVVLGFVIGVLWLGSIRFFTIKNDAVHYHANFALYINGAREDFKSPLYYEEVQSCTATGDEKPETRTHMHNNENNVVHVHDAAVTWGHFFANLGFGLTDSALVTDQDAVYSNGEAGTLSFVLNGEGTTSIANKVIDDEDVLLISYGHDTDETLQERYKAIPADAHKYDDTVDPAGCSGSEPLTFGSKLKKAFWIE